MSYHLSSGGLSARSLRGYLRHPGAACDAFGPGNVVYSPGTGQRGPGLCGGHQEACYEPASCPAPCYGPRTGSFCSPCQMSHPAACGGSGLEHFGYGGSRGPSAGYGPSFGRPSSFSSRSYQSACYQPACSSRYFGPTY
ncbi:keratin-associated protein 15-1-like [Molossus nigricans]